MVTTNRRKRKSTAPAQPDAAGASLIAPAPEAPAAPQKPAAPAPKEESAPAPEPATDRNDGQPAQAAAVVAPASSSGPEEDASLEHGRHVAFLADRLFDELAPLHGLGKGWRRRLHQAALLHDIGFAEGRKGHHKTSMRKIDADRTLDLADKDRPLVALLARYHRKAWPSLKHRRFAALSGKKREAVRTAAALLRIADGLDYRHLGNIQDITAEITESAVRLYLRTCGECAPERARALKKGDLLEHLTGRALECICREA